MSLRILAAAERTGIGCTLLPGLVRDERFRRGAPPRPRQARFVNDLEGYLEIWDDAARAVAGKSDMRLGAAPHSLRAVLPEQLQRSSRRSTSAIRTAPLPIARQRTARGGRSLPPLERPDAGRVARRERQPLAALDARPRDARDGAGAFGDRARGSLVALCPTTEANLGDGIFPTASFVHDGGRYAIGSDGHMTIGAAEELRWLEYLQRLTRRAALRPRRARELRPARRSTPRRPRPAASRSAARSARSCRGIGPISSSSMPSYPLLAGRTPATMLDSYIFAAGAAAVRDVMVGGSWVIEGARASRRDRDRDRRAADRRAHLPRLVRRRKAPVNADP